MAPKPYIKTLISKISRHWYWKSSYCNSSYWNMDSENIIPPNHIEPKSLKFHIEPAVRGIQSSSNTEFGKYSFLIHFIWISAFHDPWYHITNSKDGLLALLVSFQSQGTPYIFWKPGRENKKDYTNDDFDGYIVEFVAEVMRELNLTYKIKPVKDNGYGSPQADGSWDGMVGEVIRGVGHKSQVWSEYGAF